MRDNIIDLAVGDPAEPPPARLQQVFADAMRHSEASHYQDPLGLPITREAATIYYHTAHGIRVDASKVAITHGGRPAMFFAIHAIASPGQTVAFFSPAYSAFAPQIINARARPLPIDLPPEPLSRSALTKLLTSAKDGLLIFNNPHNPTGRVFSSAEIESLCSVTKDLGIRIVSDFVYADLYEHESPASILNFDPTAVEFVSISKPFRACGWRVGATVGDPAWIGRIIASYDAMNGVPYANQRAAAAAWLEMPEVENFRADLAHRREILVTGLRLLGFSVDVHVQNRSGLFVWAKIPDYFVSAAAVARLFSSNSVLVSDGATFGASGIRHIRLALNEPADVLSDAITRMSVVMEA